MPFFLKFLRNPRPIRVLKGVQKNFFCTQKKKKEKSGGRGPNAVLKKIKNGNFKVTSRFWGGKKKNFPPSEAVGNNKSEV